MSILTKLLKDFILEETKIYQKNLISWMDIALNKLSNRSSVVAEHLSDNYEWSKNYNDSRFLI